MWSESDNKTRVKRHMAQEDCECICLAFVFAYVVGKNPKTPNLSPMADDAIARRYMRYKIFLVYLWAHVNNTCEKFCSPLLLTE